MVEFDKKVLTLFVFILSIRFISIALTLHTGNNPYAQADAQAFIDSAATIAEGLKDRDYRFVERSVTYQKWGTFLAPFWVLPGPSVAYASIANAFVGSIAVYNVYPIVRYYHSHYAGMVAVLPLALYPSIILVHGTLLREAIVLFGITTAARMLLIPNDQSPIRVLSIVTVSLGVATLHRPDNLPLYVAAIGTGLIVSTYRHDWLRNSHLYLSVALSFACVILLRDRIREGISYLMSLREIRGRGRTAYLVDVFPSTLLQAIVFSWIGAAYFLFSPFPWMIENVQDLIVGIESLGNVVYTIATPFGFRYVAKRNPAGATGLLVAFMIGIVVYGLATVNTGTAVRHRQMFLWVIFLFGGIGFGQLVDIRWSEPQP